MKKTAVKKSTRKTWVQKRDIDKLPAVKKCERAFADIHAGEKMLIATPAVLDRYVRQVPKGTLVSLPVIRKDLAMEYHADKTCPVTTGIFLRIISEAAYEEYSAGKPVSRITPFWRVIGPASPTAKKLSFGTNFLHAMQKKEGILPKG